MRVRNRFCLVGRLGKSPEKILSTNNRKTIVRFSIAVNNVYKDGKGEKRQSTDWFVVTIFSEKLAHTCMSYLQKGSEVTVMGHLRATTWVPDNWSDKQGNPVKVSRFDLIGTDLIIHGGQRSKESSHAGYMDDFPDDPGEDEYTAIYDENSIPF